MRAFFFFLKKTTTYLPGGARVVSKALTPILGMSSCSQEAHEMRNSASGRRLRLKLKEIPKMMFLKGIDLGRKQNIGLFQWKSFCI